MKLLPMTLFLFDVIELLILILTLGFELEHKFYLEETLMPRPFDTDLLRALD